MWFPLLVFVGIAAVLCVVVEVSHDHLSPEHPITMADLSQRSTWYSGWLEYDTGWYVYLAEHGYDVHQQDAFKAGQQSGVAYFPAYELVTGPQAAYETFAADRRNVTEGAVRGVMTAFFESFLEPQLITHAVRGMVPKNRLGRVLMTKLKVYKGNQHPHAAQQPAPLKAAT